MVSLDDDPHRGKKREESISSRAQTSKKTTAIPGRGRGGGGRRGKGRSGGLGGDRFLSFLKKAEERMPPCPRFTGWTRAAGKKRQEEEEESHHPLSKGVQKVVTVSGAVVGQKPTEKEATKIERERVGNDEKSLCPFSEP